MFDRTNFSILEVINPSLSSLFLYQLSLRFFHPDLIIKRVIVGCELLIGCQNDVIFCTYLALECNF